MILAIEALAGEPMCIQPAWLDLMAGIAQRQDRATIADLAEKAKQGHETGWGLKAYLDGITASSPPRRLDAQSRAWVQGNTAMVPVSGPIFPKSNMMTEYSGATSLTMFKRDMMLAYGDQDIDAVVAVIDSPGGVAQGLATMSDWLYANKDTKPTFVHVTGTMASAAYWLGTSMGPVSVDQTALIGSIGTAATLSKQVEPDLHGRMGYEVVSTGSENKRLDPSTEEGKEKIVALLNKLQDPFFAAVARNRGVSDEVVRSEKFLNGDITVGADAVKRGMADSVSTLEEVMSRASRIGKQARSRSGRGN